ncbi:MAG: C45 family peptidase [Ferruginibacter sp.]
MNKISEIILRGNAYERGLQHGQQLGPQIKDFLNDNKARVNSIREFPLSDDVIQSQVQLHAAVIEAELPEIATELKGLAAGAGISYEEAVFLQVRVELMSYGDQDLLEGDCSTVAIKQPGHPTITGQTIDLPGNMTELGCVFRIIPENDDEPEILMYGFAGLLGYMGMNSHGLSININMVVSNDWQPGVSPYLLVRHFLTLATTEECLQELNRITRSSSRSFVIADKTSLLNVEFTATQIRVLEETLMFHTNHYLDTDLIKEDKIHFLFKNSSIKRLKLLQQLFPSDENVSPETLFNIFADHTLYPVGICAHGEGNIRRSETVGTVVMEPESFTMYARKGNACTGETEIFRMKAHSAV